MGQVVAMKTPDKLFFRVREGGAAVFRVDTENRQRRLELQQVATIKLAAGDIKPFGKVKLTALEMESMADWIVERRKLTTMRQEDELRKTIDAISATAHWVHFDATADQLDEYADDLLMAMHDLRSSIVKQKSKNMQKQAAET